MAHRSSSATVIKKYGNRRLYDTGESRYITLEELAEKIRGGEDVRVLDAGSGEDLTQATLAQIILESRGASRLLPVPLLVQLIRMGDEALAEFMGRYVSAALEMYLSARSGAQALAPYMPMATMPFTATNALARLVLGAGQMLAPQPSWAESAHAIAAAQPAPPPAPATPPPRDVDDVAELRRELAELKDALLADRKKKPARKPRG